MHDITCCEAAMDHTVRVVEDTSSVIELRQYTLHPGQRETLIELFEREFVETQEAAGMRLIGQFRDIRNPDRFVWVRGFRDMSSRARALQSFYGGTTWAMHRAAANATMIDSDDVLLLRPMDAGFRLPSARAAVGSPTQPAALIVATLYLLAAPVDAEFVRFFDTQMRPALIAAGAVPIARLQTELADNNFPALPVRAGEHAFVWFAAFADATEHARHVEQLSSVPDWHTRIQPRLSGSLAAPEQVLMLEPTPRSLLGRGAAPGYTLERTGDVHDFDFLAGNWQVLNRRLRQRGSGSGEWDEFPATMHARLHLDGTANSDEIVFHTQGWSGMTVRAFEVAQRRWAIYWINSRHGALSSPVFGGFSGNRGEFFGEDEDDGRPVQVRFRWTRLTPDHVRWEQAFAYGAGAQWETNWTMDMTRAGGAGQ
jgi:hypothetical protein